MRLSIVLMIMMFGIPSGPGVLCGWSVSATCLIRYLVNDLIPNRCWGYSGFGGVVVSVGGGGKKDADKALTLSRLEVAIVEVPLVLILRLGIRAAE